MINQSFHLYKWSFFFFFCIRLADDFIQCYHFLVFFSFSFLLDSIVYDIFFFIHLSTHTVGFSNVMKAQYDYTEHTDTEDSNKKGGRKELLNEWMNELMEPFFSSSSSLTTTSIRIFKFFFSHHHSLFLSLSPFPPSLIFVSCEIHNVVDTMDKIDQRKKIFCYSCLD